MKRVFSAILLLVSTFVWAQAPQAISYQGVARNSAGLPFNAGALDVRFSIRQGTATGTISYQETHNTTTDQFGGFALQIGRGAAITGTFSAIDWGNGPYFLEVELDLNSSGTFVSVGTSEMLSVPYALYAETAGNAGGQFITYHDSTDFTIISDTLTDSDNNGSLDTYGVTIQPNDSTLWCRIIVNQISTIATVNGGAQCRFFSGGVNIDPCLNGVVGMSTYALCEPAGPGDFVELVITFITDSGIEVYRYSKQL